MICFPNCKLNLGLKIVEKRADGFHNIETVFLPLALHDVLEIIPAESTSFFQSGIPIPGSSSDNIILKAYHLLKKDFKQIKDLSIHLLKNIPTGAGLGGGSADGTYMLKCLNSYFNLNLTSNQLESYALQLGSDCPFFVHNKPMFASGRGEIFEPIDIHLTDYFILIINPGIHINTGWAFSQLKPNAPKKSIKDIVRKELSQWKYELFNDFEKPVCTNYPELNNIKSELYKIGAIYAAMSGSGSTFFGIFKKEIMGEIKNLVSNETRFKNNKLFFTSQL